MQIIRLFSPSVIYQHFSTMSSSVSAESKSVSHPPKVVPIAGVPPWLESLEKGMKYLFCGVAGLSLVAYGCMVYTQEQWRINHQQLQKLKNQEHQLAITDARIKNQMAQDAEKPQSGLVSPQPADFLYVPANMQVVSVPVETAPLAKPISLPGPIGY
jgi:hypothetical protein